MKAFSSEQILELNRQASSGKFVEAAIFTRDMNFPTVKDYFIRYRRKLSFMGQTYQPLDMSWGGIKTSTSMELPVNQVSVSNLGGQVIDYLEDDTVVIDGNDVELQILFINKFNKISILDSMIFQVELIVADYHKQATFHLGVNYSLNDIIPRETIETQEYPGIRSDVIRVGTV